MLLALAADRALPPAVRMLTLPPANLTTTTAAHSRVLVAFCAEFSPHCLALRGELAEAAVALRGAAVLAMVESRYEDEDMRQPIATLSWYEDGTAHPYTGGRVADSITQWVWSRLNASGAARLEATRAKKDELRRLASSSAAPLRPLQSQLGKLRSDMMKWYCVGGQHDDIPPCKVRHRPRRRREAPDQTPNPTGCALAQTFSFMTKMRATSSAEEKKKLLTARQEAMKKLSPEERKKVSRRPQPGASCHLASY